MVERFQTDRTERVFLLSLEATGTGPNLTAASQVIHFDLWCAQTATLCCTLQHRTVARAKSERGRRPGKNHPSASYSTLPKRHGIC